MVIFKEQTGGRRTLKPAFGLAAITLIGLLVRLVDIDRWPLWSDEALTPLIAQWPVNKLFLAPVDPTPGLYYSLHKLILGPMTDAADARLLSLLFGTLLIPCVFLLAREARAPALLSAALVALSFPLIDYSQEARAYSLLVLLVTISAACFIRWSKSRGPRALLATLLTCLLAFYTHFASVFWIGPVVVAIFWLGRRQVIAPLLLTATLAVPELLRLARYSAGPFAWLAQATPLQAADTIARALLPFRPAAVWLVLILLLIGWRAWANRARITGWIRTNPAAALAIGILVAAPLLAWLFGLVARPVFMTRTILIGVPGAMVTLALLLKFEQRIVRFAVVALYAAGLLVTGTTRQKEDWREIAERVGGDAVLMCQPGQVAAMRHAMSGNGRMLLNRDDGLAEIGGTPWQRAYYLAMSSRDRMEEARRRGKGVSLSLYPVWAVRSGQIEDLPAAPLSLGRALSLCKSDQARRRPTYIPD